MKGYVVQVNFNGDIIGAGTFVFIGGRAELNMRTFVKNKLMTLSLYYVKRFRSDLTITDDYSGETISLIQAIHNEDWMDIIVDYGGYVIRNYSIVIYGIDNIIDSNDIVLDMEALK